MMERVGRTVMAQIGMPSIDGLDRTNGITSCAVLAGPRNSGEAAVSLAGPLGPEPYRRHVVGSFADSAAFVTDRHHEGRY